MNFAVNKGDNTEEFIDSLREIYSIDELKQLARKNLYICPYCQVPLRVKSGEKRGSYFAHPSNQACIESRQVEIAYHQYKKQIKRESFRHPVLVSMIKDELETAAAGRDFIEIIEGYRIPRFTKYFPDLYVQIGSREWALTILTDMTEKDNIEHSRSFKARHEYFIENGLTPLWLIDKANFAAETMKKSIVMWEIEWLSSLESSEDYVWQNEIATYASREDLFDELGYTTAESNSEIEIKSIYYISQIDEKNFIRVYRFIEDMHKGIYRGFLIGETSRVPFSQALHMENESFMLRDPEQEVTFRETFKKEFLNAREARRSRAERNLQYEKERKEMLREIKEKEKESVVDAILIEEPEVKPVDQQLKVKNCSTTVLSSRASALSSGERELDDYFRQVFREMNKGRAKSLVQNVSEKKYKAFVEKMLTIRVEGASYIKSSNHIWRGIILKWLEENYYVENWTVSIQTIMDLLRKSQIEFTANKEDILKMPIRDFLTTYQKLLKKDLRLNSRFIINN